MPCLLKADLGGDCDAPLLLLLSLPLLLPLLDELLLLLDELLLALCFLAISLQPVTP